MVAPAGAGLHNDSSLYQSEDDILNGQRAYDAETGQMTDLAMTLDRRHNGGMVPPPNEYESYEEIKNQQVSSTVSWSICNHL